MKQECGSFFRFCSVVVDLYFFIYYILLQALKNWINYTRSREFSVFCHKK